MFSSSQQLGRAGSAAKAEAATKANKMQARRASLIENEFRWMDDSELSVMARRILASFVLIFFILHTFATLVIKNIRHTSHLLR